MTTLPERPTVFLGLDPATNCGWALIERASVHVAPRLLGFGSWQLKRGASLIDTLGMRLLRLRTHLALK